MRGDNLCRRARWSSTVGAKTPRGSLLIQGGLFSNARNLESLFRNTCQTIQGTKSQFKSKDLSGQLSYDHLFRDSLTISSQVFSSHCILAQVLSALSILTHLIPISVLEENAFITFIFTEVGSGTQRKRHSPAVPQRGGTPWGQSQAFWAPHWIDTNSSCFLAWKGLAVDLRIHIIAVIGTYPTSQLVHFGILQYKSCVSNYQYYYEQQ